MLRGFYMIRFLIGFICGLLLALMFGTIQVKDAKKSAAPLLHRVFTDRIYETYFTNLNVTRLQVPMDSVRYSNNTYISEAAVLNKRISIACVVLVTAVRNIQAVKDTWGKNCNDLIFLNSSKTVSKTKLPVIKSKRISSWSVLCRNLMKLSDRTNWVLVVYDNTFAVPENLRFLVAGLDDNKTYYLGHPTTFWTLSFNLAEAGYALSRGTLVAFQKSLGNDHFCDKDIVLWNTEDFTLGQHLSKLNIKPSDTRDPKGLTTFNGLTIMKLFFPGSSLTSNYYKHSAFPIKCCSPHPVTFKTQSTTSMYSYYYFLYVLALFGNGTLGNRRAFISTPDDKVWKDFLVKEGIKRRNVSPQEYYKLWKKKLYHEKPGKKSQKRS